MHSVCIWNFEFPMHKHPQLIHSKKLLPLYLPSYQLIYIQYVMLIYLLNFRCDLADRRYAEVASNPGSVSSTDNGNDITTCNADTWLVHVGIGCSLRFHRNHRLDSPLPHDKHSGTEAQARIRLDRSIFISLLPREREKSS